MKADDPGRFFAMLRDRLPAHPVLDRLASSGRWFADADLSADIQVGGDTAGLSAALTGVMNGSTVTADIALPALFELTAPSDVTVNARLENDESAILLGQAGLDPLPLGNDGAGHISVDLTQEGDEPASAMLVFETDRTQFRGEGQVALGAAGFGTGKAHLTLASENLEPYLLMNGIGIPQFGTGLPVRLVADVAIAPEQFQLQALAGEVAGNPVSSDSLVIDRTASAVSVAGNLAVDTVDLAWLGEAAYGSVTDPETGALSEKPFSMPIFGAAEARLQLRARTLRPWGLGDVTDFSASLTHRNGGIVLEDAAGAWQDGRLSGRLAMSNGEGNGIFQTRLTVEGANLTPLMWRSGDAPVATGRFDAVVAVEATAQTPAELMASLNGSGELTLSDVTVYGLEPGALPAVLTEIDDSDGEVTEDKVRPVAERLIRRGTAPLGTVSVPFTVTDGEARAQNVTAGTGGSRLSGEARIDLIEQSLRGGLAVTYDAGDEGLAGGDATVRWAYSGALADPQVEFDVAPLTNFLSLRAFEQERRRVETLQASVLEKQRLRREVSLYRFAAAERKRAEAEERARAEEEARRAEAEAEAERERAEAAARAAEEARRRAEQVPTLNIPPTQDLFRDDLTPLQSPTIQGLPGVEP